jgi:hypothetical protein
MLKTLAKKVMNVMKKDEDIFKYLEMFNEINIQANYMNLICAEMDDCWF